MLSASLAERFPQQGERRGRVSRPPGVHGERRALVFHAGSLGRARLGEQTRQRLPAAWTPGGTGGVAEHAVLPSLRSVVSEHDQAGHVGEAAEGHGVPRRTCP